MQGSEQLDWLIQTKLQPPLLRSDVIPRPHLLAALCDGLASHRLTLLSAPAGYGKTTLLAAYCAKEREGRGAKENRFLAPLPPCSPAPIAWLTLDEGENDPALFLAYLIAALQRLNPACGAAAQTLLADLPNPGAQARHIVGVLINDILETLSAPFALILDDLHLITEPAVYAALDYLLERLPPQMHLAAGTRYDPPLALARLRARGQLAELRVPNLRFTPDEAATFLNQRLRLGLSPDDLTALQARTEGWVAGLCLLAGSLDRIPTSEGRTAFISHLAQTDRHVFDFLADEVLSCQSENVRAFLLETSILPELIPSLCEAVTGRSDAQAMLDDLDRHSLFVAAVDEARTIFRYHALFAEFLRQRLAQETPERVVGLHRRAAKAQTTADRAIGHYLAAEMWEEAAQAIEQVGQKLLPQGLLDTLIGWIHALPDEVREARPRLAYLLGVCTWQKGNIDVAKSLQEQALHGFEAAGDEAGQGETLTELAGYALMQADFARSREMILRALARPIPSHSRVQLLMGRAVLNVLSGDLAQAEADFEMALTVLQETNDLDALRILVTYLTPLLAVLPGGLERIERALRQAAPHFGDQISPSRVFVEGAMAFVHFWRGRPAQAIQAGESALAISERLSDISLLSAVTAATVAVAYAGQGDYVAADHFFDLLFDQIEWIAVEQFFEVGFLYLLGKLRWLQNRLEEARQVYARMEAATSLFELPFAPMLRLMMQGLLEMAEASALRPRSKQSRLEHDRRHAEAERLLRQAAAMERNAPLSILFGSARLMLAHLYLKQNCPQDTLAELRPVLAECERRETPGRILQEGAAVVPVLRLAVERDVHAPFAARLLTLLGADATGKPTPVRVPETGETLTRREVEVLRLIATGASNRAIAEQLVISKNTVKTHVAHILRKLDVHSRTQAVARARELGIGITAKEKSPPLPTQNHPFE